MKDAFERRRHAPVQFRGRVSVSVGDAGYQAHCNLIMGGYKVIVLLNGLEQKNCVWADPDTGEVCRFKLACGTFAPSISGSAQTETIKGDVTVRLERSIDLADAENAA